MKHILCLLALFSTAAMAGTPTVSLTADSSAGTFNWNSTGAANCAASANPAVSGWSGSIAASGSQALPIVTAPTTLTINCPSTTGTAVVSWTMPATNTDGSALTDLAGFNIWYGLSATTLNTKVSSPLATARTQTVAIAPGLTYFAVTAVNSAGVNSAFSNIVSKTVVLDSPGIATLALAPRTPSAPTNVAVN